MKRINIAPDGSCLFSSIDYLMTGIDDVMSSLRLREVCIDTIKNDTINYNTDTLGESKDNNEYCEWMSQVTTYGGGNELAILAKYLNINIVVVACIINQPCIILAQYSPDKDPKQFIHLLYTGQHYDALISTENERIFTEAQTQSVLFLAQVIRDKRELELKTRKRTKLKCSCGVLCDNKELWKIHITEEHMHDEDFDYLCEEIEEVEIVANINDD